MSGLKRIEKKEATIITPAAIKFIRAYHKNFLMNYVDTLEQVNGRSFPAVKKHFVDVAKGVNSPGEGLDYEITRLRGKRFKKISVTSGMFYSPKDNNWKNKKRRALCINTSDVVVKFKGDLYSLGEYMIYFPTSDLESRVMANPHFIPVRNPYTRNRHPHHLAYANSSCDSPTCYQSSTCFGSFAGILTSALSSGRLTDFLISIWTFLNIYNPGSPLTRLSNLSHAVRLKK